MEVALADAVARERLNALVSGGLALSGLLLASLALLGVVGSLLLLRWLGTLLFDVTPYDAPTYAVVLGLLAAVAVLASYIPARHAGRVEPLLALRHE